MLGNDDKKSDNFNLIKNSSSDGNKNSSSRSGEDKLLFKASNKNSAEVELADVRLEIKKQNS